MAKYLERVKDLGRDLNNAARESQAISQLLGASNNTTLNALGAAAQIAGYGRKPRARKPKAAAKKKKAGGAKKKPKTAAQKAAAARRRAMKRMRGAGFLDFLKNVASVPIYAASGALGGLNGGIQNL